MHAGSNRSATSRVHGTKGYDTERKITTLHADVWLLHLINGLATRSAGLDALMVTVAKYAPVVFGLGLILQWFLPAADDGVRLERRRRVVLAVLAAALALAVAQVPGMIHFRQRPFAAQPGVHLLLDRSPDASFPSDHATGAAALSYLLAFESLLWALGSWGLAALLAFSRVFAGTHYPSDVLAGTALGLTVSWALYRVRGALFPLIDRLLVLVDTAPLPGKTFAAQRQASLVNRTPQPKRG